MRRVTVSQQLNFLDQPLPETCVWDRLDPEPRKIFVAALAHLIARAALTNITQEHCHDRYRQDQTNSSAESCRSLCPPVHHLPRRASPGVDRPAVCADRESPTTRLDQRASDPH